MIANISLDLVITTFVETMLPIRSDKKLGLYIPIQMTSHDGGFDSSGNLVFEPQNYAHFISFLFIRPSNYTKVFVISSDSPINLNAVWTMECDHDSCWRSDGLRKLTDIHFNLCDPICKARKCAPKDVNTYHNFYGDPRYVHIKNMNMVNPAADRYSSEGRQHTFVMEHIEQKCLTSYTYKDIGYNGKEATFNTGLYIKDSECDRFFREHRIYFT